MVAENQTAEIEICLLRINEVTARVGLSRSVVNSKMSLGKFPAPVYPARRAPRWRSDVISAWIDSLPTNRAAA